MISKKVIVCDLDGTLSASKLPLTIAMAEVLCKLITKYYVVVVSGAAYSQFQKQFISELLCGNEFMKNLFLFPTNGSACYVFDTEKEEWIEVYNELLTEAERNQITTALRETMRESGMDFSESYGEIIEDRGGQITFSGKGQMAPIKIKNSWDLNQTKRKELVKILKDKIPQFEIHIGGSTSIDVTRKGIDKAYAIKKVKELLNVSDDDIVYVGDALYKGGNDSSIKKTGVDYIQESGPEETIEFLKQYI